MAADAASTPRVTEDAGKPTGNRVYLRVFIYVAAVHLFAALLFLMFAVGARH